MGHPDVERAWVTRFLDDLRAAEAAGAEVFAAWVAACRLEGLRGGLRAIAERLLLRAEREVHQGSPGVAMASEANEPGSESGKRSDDRRGAARGTRAGSWPPQEGEASSHLTARLPPRSPGSFAAATMTTRIAS